jgi:pteridine reductase
MFQVNTLAPAALIAETEAALLASACGNVVNLCDIAADRPWRHHMAYCASKAALVNVTKAAARKLAPRVHVNGVSPGIAAFPDHYDEATRANLIDKVPLGRAGDPDGIARMVRFLVEQGDYITGQIIRVDGGRSLG